MLATRSWPINFAAMRRLVLCLLVGSGRDVLAEALGIPLSGNITNAITTFTPHAVTTGVVSVPFLAGSCLAGGSNPAIQVLGRRPTGEGVMGVPAKGNAKVFFIGDVNGIQLVPQPLVQNLVAWGIK